MPNRQTQNQQQLGSRNQGTSIPDDDEDEQQGQANVVGQILRFVKPTEIANHSRTPRPISRTTIRIPTTTQAKTTWRMKKKVAAPGGFDAARGRRDAGRASNFFSMHRRSIMGIILWLVIGGVVGWLASIVMRRDESMGVPMNIVAGIVGAMLGGWLIGPMVGAPSINSGSISAGSLFVSFIGAVILLAIVNLATRKRVR